MIIPLILLFVAGYGLIHHVKIYEVFVEGATQGFHTAIHMLPTLIGLLLATGVLKASGFLDLLSTWLTPFALRIHIPAPAIPLIIIKQFSSSAATGMILSIFKDYGTDSRLGLFVSILASCTETIFYTLSIYTMSAKITKTRWTLPGALLSSAAGIVASAVLSSMLH